eukprot:scaffold6736_cov171-Alexandrium_tamarense.AAC.2
MNKSSLLYFRRPLVFLAGIIACSSCFVLASSSSTHDIGQLNRLLAPAADWDLSWPPAGEGS